MDLGIRGKSAIVCGASSGLGLACAKSLLAEGVDVYICGRNASRLAEAVTALQAIVPVPAQGDESALVKSVVCDVTTPLGREALFELCPAPDILINNAGGPPPGDFRTWDQQVWFDALNANMLSAIDMIKRALDGMVERRFGRIINITSIAVKLPQAELGLSNAVRAGLTGFVSGIARDPAQHNVTINNLLPGFIDTARMRQVLAAKADANQRDIADFTTEFFNTIPAKRAGTPEEFGALCAFLASEQAAYMTAQNILIDGGLYPGTF